MRRIVPECERSTMRLGAQGRSATAHAGDQSAVGHARGHEDGVVAGDQVVGLVGAVHVESGGDALLPLLVVPRGEPGLHEAAERLDRRGRGDALGAAADADAHVDARLVASGVDAAGHVAVEHEAGSGSGGTDLGDEPLVSRSIEHGHAKLAHVLADSLREGADVVADGPLDVDDAGTGSIRDDLVHVEHGGGIEHGSPVGRRR